MGSRPGVLRRPRAAQALLLALIALACSSCSINKFAAGRVADSLTKGPDVFGTEDDPELVRDALPFGLKTMESLLVTLPEHRGLLLQCCRGFTQYAFAFVQADADEIEATDRDRAMALRARALKLYLRARDYGLRGLERDYRGIAGQLQARPAEAVKRLKVRDVPMLYWTAAAWGSAISLGKDRPDLLADLEAVRALMNRGLALSEGYDGGSIHEAMIVLDALPAAMGGSVERARGHFERAVALSRGERASPYVTMAQSVCVETQDRAEFERLLNKALEVDPDKEPSQRLATILLQRKARALLAREDELFIAPDTLRNVETR